MGINFCDELQKPESYYVFGGRYSFCFAWVKPWILTAKSLKNWPLLQWPVIRETQGEETLALAAKERRLVISPLGKKKTSGRAHWRRDAEKRNLWLRNDLHLGYKRLHFHGHLCIQFFHGHLCVQFPCARSASSHLEVSGLLSSKGQVDYKVSDDPVRRSCP